MEHQEAGQAVAIVDVRIPFWSMVTLMVKLAIAAIPALLILAAIGYAVFVALLSVGTLLSVAFASTLSTLFTLGGVGLFVAIVAMHAGNRAEQKPFSKGQVVGLLIAAGLWIAAMVIVGAYGAGYRLVSPSVWWRSVLN